MQRTRWDIIQILKKQQSASLGDLAQIIGLHPVTLRSHLAILEKEGLVSSGEERGKIGRPYFVYTLSDKAAELFPKGYVNLTNVLLEELEASLPEEELNRFLDSAATRFAAPYLPHLEGLSPDDRLNETIKVLNEHAAMVELHREDGRCVLCNVNCLYPDVSRTHPAVCRIDEAIVSRLLGMPVKRLQRMADGDPACAFALAAQDS